MNGIPKRGDVQLATEAKEFRERMLRRGDYRQPEPAKEIKVPVTKVTNPLQREQ